MTNAFRFAATALIASTFAITGCAGDEGDDIGSGSSLEGEELQATFDELASNGPEYAAGTTLKVLAPLNLRSGAGTGYSSRTVMPEGASVTVVSRSGGNAWVNVRYGSYTGWAHTTYLATAANNSGGNTASQSGYSSSRGTRFANYADRVDGRRAGGWCAREVSNSVIGSGIVSSSVWRRGNAWDMVNYMVNNSSYRNRVKFRVSNNRTKGSLQKGSIIGWRPGVCGFSTKYGHVEVDTRGAGTKVCSDYCSGMKCNTASAVLYPTN